MFILNKRFNWLNQQPEEEQKDFLKKLSLLPWKEERNWVLRRFQQLRSYRDEIETQNREKIPYSSRIVPRGLSVAEGP